MHNGYSPSLARSVYWGVRHTELGEQNAQSDLLHVKCISILNFCSFLVGKKIKAGAALKLMGL